MPLGHLLLIRALHTRPPPIGKLDTFICHNKFYKVRAAEEHVHILAARMQEEGVGQGPASGLSSPSREQGGASCHTIMIGRLG